MPSELMSHQETVEFTGFKTRFMSDEEVDELLGYIAESEENIDPEQIKKEIKDTGITYDFEGISVKFYSVVMVEYQVRTGRRRNDRCMFWRSTFIKRGDGDLDVFYEDVDDYFYL